VYNGNTSTFGYGADGLRHRETVNGTATDYVIDGQSAVRELKAGVSQATYLTGISGPCYRRDDIAGTICFCRLSGRCLLQFETAPTVGSRP
jgi:hypothetical protein